LIYSYPISFNSTRTTEHPQLGIITIARIDQSVLILLI
jgi:hypothetical protein